MNNSKNSRPVSAGYTQRPGRAQRTVADAVGQNSRAAARTGVPPRAAKSRSGEPSVSVYIARYILFLIVYLALLLIAVISVMAFLRASGGGEWSALAVEPRTASASSVSTAMLEADEEDYIQSVINSVAFKLDLSEYEQYMNLSDRDAYVKLINQTHPLDNTYKPDDLTSVPYVRAGVETPYLRLYAAKALEAMLNEAYAEGCAATLTVTSCYRSYDYQTTLFEYRVSVYTQLGAEAARAKAATIVAYPGQSEHQSGLAADIHTLSSADTKFDDSFEAKWLSENSWKFGFILRYREDKSDITGISFEPWHFRFVGRYHAYKIYESGLCLEEYCAQTGLGQ